MNQPEIMTEELGVLELLKGMVVVYGVGGSKDVKKIGDIRIVGKIAIRFLGREANLSQSDLIDFKQGVQPRRGEGMAGSKS